MANTSRKRQQTERTGDTAWEEKKAGRSRKSPAAKKTQTVKSETKKDAEKSSRKSVSSKRNMDSNEGKKSTSRRQEQAADAAESSFMRTEVAIIVTFAISVLLFLSNFGLCGVLGSFLRSMLLGIFGVIGYIVPFLLFIGVCFYLSNRGNRKAIIKIAAVLELILALCGLAQFIFGGGQHLDWGLGDYYAQAGGGGLIGGILIFVLCGTIGTIGTVLVVLMLLALGCVLITERSLVNFIKRGSGKAYECAKEDMSRRRELHEEKKEEKRRLREEQRVRGVDLDAARLSEFPVMRDFADGVPEGTVLGPKDAPEKYRKEQYMTVDTVADDDIIDNTIADDSYYADELAADSSESAREVQEENPADVFRGQIFHGGQNDETLQEQSAPEKEFEEKEEVTESSASDQLLKRLYVRRDTRTMEEFVNDKVELDNNTVGDDIQDEWNPDLKATVHNSEIASGSFESDWENISEPVENNLDDAPESVGNDWENTSESVKNEVESDPESDADDWENTSEPVGNNWEDTSEPVENDWDDVSDNAEKKDEISFKEPELEKNDVDGYYKPLESERVKANSTETKGSFFVPGESKTVVTASGKVIETDTEALQKAFEKKREERKALPIDELTVTEQIERKEEEEKSVKQEYVFPPLTLLKRGSGQTDFSDKEYRETAIKLQQTLQNFGVGVTVTNISCGPTVTRYELHPEQGVKVSKIVALADDIKLNLAAADIRIEAPIPGKAAVGIEVPNRENHVVLLRDLLESETFRQYPSRLAFAVGKDIAGQTVVSDIAKMPHLLIAGATGSGKSVCINTLIMSVIYKAKPSDVKLIMIDPKVVELSVYNGIPHLLIPVVTDPKKASGALNWAVSEMTDRYQKFAKYGVRDLKGFNAKIDSIADIDDPKKPEKLPQIIIIVDELADLMMVAPGEVEDAICRLAQLARAAGIHLVIATQRPSVNVITGVIKANIPSRIAFSVSSGVDSRTIIDMNGAEKLLGKGDMLFYPSGYQKPQRVQGAFVSDNEVSAVVDFLSKQGLTADYSTEVESKIRSTAADSGFGGGERDAYFTQAGKFIIEKDKASIGMLQRMFKIGFNRAARIMDQLADAGVVGEEEGTKPRKILMSMEQFENMLEEGY